MGTEPILTQQINVSQKGISMNNSRKKYAKINYVSHTSTQREAILLTNSFTHVTNIILQGRSLTFINHAIF